MSHKINIGIDEKSREEIGEGLSRLLADTYTLYLQTHNFHWNVTGPFFQQLHVLFEEHYTELAVAVDDIAERIRALGILAPGTYKELAELTSIEEVEGNISAEEMIGRLVDSHETVVRTARKVLQTAQEAEDESSASLVGDRLVVHEKTAWMLRSHLQN
ncbi:Dps family protein [Kangiella spongicola]|jgi:starvation-inducible DNA-binding protein|uniref:DNA starvation/stationary phase protection protein n=1 Tax=Kangiella spongicola TaxID=796379 RepID=A0A318D582_9GAMM|nr:Dps family protein [Kangiella spongicola]MBV35142.1 DNA starvation/stationary phase protection protein [Rickettsiales bacterium]PXF64420.1 DNA starvation/stationary phase protection protein [Kangiella spongicola]